MKEKNGSEFWDRRSRVFDRQVTAIYSSAYKKTVKRALRFLKDEDQILEIGCGTGIVTMPVSEHVKHVTALDISDEMLAKATEKAKEQGRENIIFKKQEIMELDAPLGSFDAVLACNVMLYMKNQEETLDRIHELLKPGGIFISATDCLGRNMSHDAVMKFWKSKLHLMPYVSFETPIGLMRKIQKRGFLVLEIVNLHKNPPNIFIVAQKIEK